MVAAGLLAPAAAARGAAAPTVTIVDRTTHNALSGPFAPGAAVALKVTYTTPSSGGQWYRTGYTFDSGSETCVDTTNHTTRNTDYTEYVNVTLPTAAGSHSVTVRYYSSDSNCTGSNRISGATATASFTIQQPVTPASPATVTLVDTSNAHATLPASIAPASVIAIKFALKIGSVAWRGVGWEFVNDAGTVVSSGCTDVGAGHASSGTTYTEYVSVSVPEPAGPYTVRARAYATADCSGDELDGSTAASFPKTTVLAATPDPTVNFSQACDARVVILLDESGSIQDTNEVTDVRVAATAFINGLANTSTQVGLVEFNTQARKVQLNSSDYNLVDSSYLTAFDRYINAKQTTPSYNPAAYSGGDRYTNWQAALDLAYNYNASKPQMVVLITDGDPTAYGLGNSPSTVAAGSSLAMNPAFAAAETLRKAGIKVFAVGVGAAVNSDASKARLRAVSGEREFTAGDSMWPKDWTVVTNFSVLENALAEIAFDLCAVHVKVVKEVDSAGSGTYVPAGSWQFTGTVSAGTGGTAYRWLTPGAAQGPPASPTSRTASTVSANGSLTFSWRPLPNLFATSQITLSDDDVLTGGSRADTYEFASVSCSDDVTHAAIPTDPAAGAATISLSGLKTNDNVTCVFKNRIKPGTLTVVKEFSGTPTTVSLYVNDPSTAKKTDNAASFSTGAIAVAPGQQVVWETFASSVAAALYESSYSCTGGGPSGDGRGPFNVTVAAGAHVTCTFTNTKSVHPGISVSKVASPTALLEPGGQVTFAVAVVNTSDGPAEVTRLTDSVYGDLTQTSDAITDTTCATGAVLDPSDDDDEGGGDTYTCSFRVQIAGNAGSRHTDTVTGELTDSTGEKVTDSAPATVEILDRLPELSVTKTADPTIVDAGGSVKFTAVVTNDSAAEAVTVDRLDDSIYGDLINGPVKASCTYADNPIVLPHELPFGESFICTFTAVPATSETDTITASATDDDGNRVDATAYASVLVVVPPAPPPTPAPTPTPPPPPDQDEPVAAAGIDLAVDKVAPARVYRSANGTATFTADIRVSNGGSEPAHNTILRDGAPAGLTFLTIVKQPSQGRCTLADAGKTLTCLLEELVQGQSVDVVVRVRASAGDASSVTNTAKAVCEPLFSVVTCTAEDSAKTLLLAPFAPPKARAAACVGVSSIRPSSLTANGKAQTLSLKATAAGIPAARRTVHATGPGIDARVRTGAHGTARLTVTPKTPGVLTLRVTGANTCDPKHVGIAAAAGTSLTG